MCKKTRIIFVIVFVLMTAFAVTAYADMGPKPSLTVEVTGLPDGEYYVDLLVSGSNGYYSNIDDDAGYDEIMLGFLREYNVDGYRTAMAYGSGTPIFGDIICDVVDGVGHVYFSYLGVPDTFKVIVVDSELNTYISDEIETSAYEAKVTFDTQTMEINERLEVVSGILQTLATFVGTIIIELLLLIVFRFSVKENLLVFMITNGATQIMLNSIVIIGNAAGGIMTGLAALIVFEPIIFIIESIVFIKFLKGYTKGRRFLYALAANFLSFGVGLTIMMMAA